MDIYKIFHSTTTTVILILIILIFLSFFIFQIGISFGLKKAEHSFKSAENFQKMFGDNRDMGPGGFIDREFPNSHGAVGKIISINLPKIVVEGNDNIERIIVITKNTVIRKQRDEIKAENLQVNDFITVLGNPDGSGQVEAKLIRIMPLPPMPQNGTGNSSSTQSL